MVIAGIKGQCDLWGVVWGGLHLEVELKSQNGRLTPEQRTWRDWCLAGQIPWLCLWPWPSEAAAETVQRWVEAIRLLAGPAGEKLTAVMAENYEPQTTRPSTQARSRRQRAVASRPLE